MEGRPAVVLDSPARFFISSPVACKNGLPDSQKGPCSREDHGSSRLDPGVSSGKLLFKDADC